MFKEKKSDSIEILRKRTFVLEYSGIETFIWQIWDWKNCCSHKKEQWCRLFEIQMSRKKWTIFIIAEKEKILEETLKQANQRKTKNFRIWKKKYFKKN